MENRLAEETSPYLLQHAHQPVHWQPWDESALAAARDTNRPILLSIGYSSCHWCHVMAHESFDDPEVAAVMNSHFVNIKVDREERPDIDRVYQTTHALLSQAGGGWPLTVFLHPDSLLPFFSGTYFPKTPRYSLPGFADLLMRIHEVYNNQADELDQQSDKLRTVLGNLNPSGTDAPEQDDDQLLAAARDALAAQYDPKHGGFGRAPKFPMPTAIDRLLRHWAHSARRDVDRQALDMVMSTLTGIARGGIHDHLGGGFFRYSTDDQWMVPHFEKMLYDNALLLRLFTDALNIGPDELFEQAADGIARWMTQEMQHPDGGLYAALDADSDGAEGAYYVWRKPDVKKLLDEAEFLIVETLYGLDKPANFEGKWNLHRRDSWRSVVHRLSLTRPDADQVLARARDKLLAQRNTRTRPSLDHKILAGWNGMAFGALARAARVQNKTPWLESAFRVADFVRDRMWMDARLYATWQGAPKYDGYLEDYANVLTGLLELLQTHWRDVDAQFARELADALLRDFRDEENGGFYLTASHHETLIHRPKPTLDDAQPPGNATAAEALQLLGHLMADTRYLDAADATLSWARGLIEAHPAGHCGMLNALEQSVQPPTQVILRGDVTEMHAWRDAISERYRPWLHCYAIPADARIVPDYLPLVSADQTTAFVCSGLSCSAPMDSLNELEAALEA